MSGEPEPTYADDEKCIRCRHTRVQHSRSRSDDFTCKACLCHGWTLHAEDEPNTINDWLALYPKKRWSHEAQGRVLFFPRTGLVGVPYKMDSNGGWAVVVTEGSKIYPRGGYDLTVSESEIESAISISDLAAFKDIVAAHNPEGAPHRG